MKRKKITREEEKDNSFMFGLIIGIILLIILGIIDNGKIDSLQKDNIALKEQMNSSFNSTVYFNTLNKNCGSSFVVYQYYDPRGEGYYVFRTKTDSEGGSITFYTPLKDCEVLP